MGLRHMSGRGTSAHMLFCIYREKTIRPGGEAQ